MGIRVHKMLGYGFVDVAFKKNKITDSRFASNGLGKISYEEATNKYSFDGYAQFLKEKLDQTKEDSHKSFEIKMQLHFLKDNKERSHYDFYRCFVHNAEYGLKNVFCIVPPDCYKTWYRYDDTIDYYDERERFAEGDGAYFKVFDDGLYPYNGLFWDVATGESIRNWAAYRRLINSGTHETDGSALDLAKALIAKDNWNEIISRINSIVPASVELLCEYTQLFSDANTFRTLKPMKYVYWG